MSVEPREVDQDAGIATTAYKDDRGIESFGAQLSFITLKKGIFL